VFGKLFILSMPRDFNDGGFNLFIFFSFSRTSSFPLPARLLSDLGKDGKLDLTEFVIACHLAAMAARGVELPSSVPESLLKSAKKAPAATSASVSDPFSALPSRGSFADAFVNVEWAVSQAEKSKYDALFTSADQSGKGHLTGLEAKKFLMKSGLPDQVLSQIWCVSAFFFSGALARTVPYYAELRSNPKNDQIRIGFETVRRG
jgi:hypothetical protein